MTENPLVSWNGIILPSTSQQAFKAVESHGLAIPAQLVDQLNLKKASLRWEAVFFNSHRRNFRTQLFIAAPISDRGFNIDEATHVICLRRQGEASVSDCPDSIELSGWDKYSERLVAVSYGYSEAFELNKLTVCVPRRELGKAIVKANPCELSEGLGNVPYTTHPGANTPYLTLGMADKTLDRLVALTATRPKGSETLNFCSETEAGYHAFLSDRDIVMGHFKDWAVAVPDRLLLVAY